VILFQNRLYFSVFLVTQRTDRGTITVQMVQRAIKIIKRSIKTFVLFDFVSFHLKAAFLVPAPALPATLPSPLLPSAEFISPPAEHPGTNPRMGHEVYMLNNGW